MRVAVMRRKHKIAIFSKPAKTVVIKFYSSFASKDLKHIVLHLSKNFNSWVKRKKIGHAVVISHNLIYIFRLNFSEILGAKSRSIKKKCYPSVIIIEKQKWTLTAVIKRRLSCGHVSGIIFQDSNYFTFTFFINNYRTEIFGD